MDNELRASWNRLCDTLKESADYIFDPALGADPSEQAEGLRHQLRMFYWATDRILENSDPDHPELGWTYPFKVGQDNPDALYQSAPVDLSRTYRLTGRIDTVRYLGLSLMDYRFGRGKITQLLDLGSPDLTDIGGGRIDIIFSPDPDPGNHIGDWFQVEPTECRLFVRQFFSDWAAESHAELYFECLDPTGPPGRLDPVRAIELFDEAAREVDTVPKYWTHFAAGPARSRPDQLLRPHPRHSRQRDQPRRQPEAGLRAVLVRGGPRRGPALRGDPARLPLLEHPGWRHLVPEPRLREPPHHHERLPSPPRPRRRAAGGNLAPGSRHPELDRPGRLSLKGPITYRWNNADSAPVPTLRLMPMSEDRRLPAPRNPSAQRR